MSRAQMLVLEHLSRGRSNREIAQEMSISVNTVKFHLKRIYSKLMICNRTDAALWYVSVNPDAALRASDH